MYLVTIDGMAASHGSHEQYTDPAGVTWICTGLEGWRRAPARNTKHDQRPTMDGAHRSAAYRSTRAYTVKGRHFAPSVELGEAAERRVLALCAEAGEVYPLTVQERGGLNLTAYVEQAGEILSDQWAPLGWEWSIPLAAADPFRYAQAWVSPTSEAGLDGVGGLDTSGSGIVMAAPGMSFGTAPVPVRAVVQGIGTADSVLVFEVRGPTSGVAIVDELGVSVVGVRGEVYAGESVFVNTSGRVAHDVPGALVPIPAYGAVNGTASARSAIWVTGGWPRLRPGEQRSFRMTGQSGPASRLTVHSRGAWI